MFPRSSAGPKCGSPRLVPSTVLCVKPTALASAPPKKSAQFRTRAQKLSPQNANGNRNGTRPKVRDRLCQIIRQHKLDPELVKAYAVDFCGTKTLREATRKQVEKFVQQLADSAANDRSALLSQLNNYMHPKQEVVA